MTLSLNRACEAFRTTTSGFVCFEPTRDIVQERSAVGKLDTGPAFHTACDELIAKFAEEFRGPCYSAQFWRYL